LSSPLGIEFDTAGGISQSGIITGNSRKEHEENNELAKAKIMK